MLIPIPTTNKGEYPYCVYPYSYPYYIYPYPYPYYVYPYPYPYPVWDGVGVGVRGGVGVGNRPGTRGGEVFIWGGGWPFIWGCLALLFPIMPQCGWPYYSPVLFAVVFLS